MPQVQNHIEHYRRDAELFDYFENETPLNRDGNRRLRQGVLRAAKLGDARGCLLLDAGSGSGWLTIPASEAACIPVLVDLGLENLRVIRARQPGTSCVAADVNRLPFRDAVFGRVVSAEVLEHTNDPEHVMRELSRVLSPDGMMVTSTPYRETLRYSLCIHCNQPTPLNAHLHSFDENRHALLCNAAGLVQQRATVQHNTLFQRSRLSYAFRWLPYPLWRILDRCCMFVFWRAATIIVTSRKRREHP